MGKTFEYMFLKIKTKTQHPTNNKHMDTDSHYHQGNKSKPQWDSISQALH